MILNRDRKQLGVAFWATAVVVLVLIGYPLSIGPVVWLDQLMAIPEWIAVALSFFYWPLQWFGDNCPNAIRKALEWYAGLWQAD